MTFDMGYVFQYLPRIDGAIGSAPDVRPDLSGLTERMLPVIILALVGRGYSDEDAIINYLNEHGSLIEDWVVFMTLDQFCAVGRNRDGIPDGLWYFHDGKLVPTISATN